MDALNKLLAIEAIKQLKGRYFRCVDTKDWNGFKAVFTPDARFDISQDVPGCILIGPENIVMAARAPLKGCVSVHHGHTPEIEITSDTTATGIWAMEDTLHWLADSDTPGATLHGYGHYVETYQCIDGRWLIQSLVLRRLRVDAVAGPRAQ